MLAEKPISAAQIKCLYALARKADLDDEQLHTFVKRVTGSDSIKALTLREGKNTIDYLQYAMGIKEPPPSDRATKAQQAMIHAMIQQLGWDDDPKRLRGFLEKRMGVSDIKFLTAKKTQACIEALKAILKRKEQQNE